MSETLGHVGAASVGLEAMSTIVDSIRVGAGMLDERSVVRSANPALRELVGPPREQLLYVESAEIGESHVERN